MDGMELSAENDDVSDDYCYYCDDGMVELDMFFEFCVKNALIIFLQAFRTVRW
jgi:hypothetical protein